MTTQQRREAVALLVQRGVSGRRSCVLAQISRNAVGYVSRRPSDSALVTDIEQVRRKHPAYGYRRVHHTLTQGQKQVLNHKRVHRVWRENGMQHPKKKPRKRRGKKGQVPLQAEYANHVWTYDFMQDATTDGRLLRFLTIVDEHNRRGIAAEPRRSFKAVDVLVALEQAFARYGAPVFLRSDNGSEFIATAVKAWLKSNGVQTHYIDPASPWQNAFGESFNGTMRHEHLNRQLFATVEEARVLTQVWLRYYNTERLHTSLGYQTPEQYFRDNPAPADGTPSASTADETAALGALPPNPQDLSRSAEPVNEGDGTKPQAPSRPSVFGPATALGSLPSVALSSERAMFNLPHKPPALPPDV